MTSPWPLLACGASLHAWRELLELADSALLATLRCKSALVLALVAAAFEVDHMGCDSTASLAATRADWITRSCLQHPPFIYEATSSIVGGAAHPHAAATDKRASFNSSFLAPGISLEPLLL